MNFQEVVMKCYDDDDLIKEFNRLTRHKLKTPRSKIEALIDDACNYNPDEAGMVDFIAFVEAFVWRPVLPATPR